MTFGQKIEMASLTAILKKEKRKSEKRGITERNYVTEKMLNDRW
jgi:hypothetical protein